LAGDRDFPPWTVTVLNDDDWGIRTALEKWSNMINYLVSNVMDTSVFPMLYKQTGLVHQYDKEGSEIARYEMVGMFPTNIDAIQLDWDQTNTIEQYDVTFAYDWWIPDPSVNRGQDEFSPTSPGDGTTT